MTHVPSLHHILVANRGEIARRILRSARSLGYRTTAIFSTADSAAPYLREADFALCVGPAAVAASYLNIPAILEAAQRSGADAIHPGYGLLSENATFAEAVRAAGLCFVGPSPEAIHLLGNKRKARQHVRALGVPCVPGYDGEDQSDARLAREAEGIGFPLMVKAAAGGGGRGLRRVASSRELSEALARARSEALKAFGDDRLILEREIRDARHVEVQVFGDQHGQVVYLGERDCSLQRRFQKVIEEAPSPAVTPALRMQLGAAAVQIARSCGYTGAGTVEMLLTAAGEFYFLEMNTRLQVEHPVTEQITGLDLVAWQFRVAEGEPLPLTQAEVKLSGHAIEARLYAEQPALGFVPATGRILLLELPSGVRIEHALEAGLEIGPHYDAMLGKLIAHAPTRDAARRQLLAALERLRLLGVATNQAFLCDLLGSTAFVTGAATTATLERAQAPAAHVPTPQAFAIAALLYLLRDQASGPYASELRGFSNALGLAHSVVLEHGRERVSVRLAAESGGRGYLATIGAASAHLEVAVLDSNAVELSCDGVRQRISFAFDAATLHVHVAGHSFSVQDVSYAPKAPSTAAGSGRAVAPMDGNLLALHVGAGEQVQAGQTLAVVEAMKLELRVVADRAGTVASLHAQRGSQVKAGQLLVELEPVS